MGLRPSVFSRLPAAHPPGPSGREPRCTSVRLTCQAPACTGLLNHANTRPAPLAIMAELIPKLSRLAVAGGPPKLADECGPG